MKSSKLSAALAAVEHGWSVFPAAANRKVPAGGLTEWERRATTDPATVARWWHRHPDRNVAIATGPSGLVVVDLDVRKPDQAPPAARADLDEVRSGLDVLVALAEAHRLPLPPETYTVRTASGGWHLYYRSPAGDELRNTSGRIGWLIDTRAAGGYVIGAGSTIDSHAYRLVRDRAELPELPDWLCALSSAPVPTTGPPTSPPRPRGAGYVEAALAGEIDRAAAAPEGQRHWQLNKAAWNLAKFVASGALARATVERELQAAGEAAGRKPAEVAATIRSGLNAGLRRHPGTAS
jgi:hypothetical protein